MYTFSHVCLGGTFDHLHQGHKHMIDTAFKIGERVSIGLSSESLLLSKKLKHVIEPYNKRKSTLINYLQQNNWNERYKLFELGNIFGIADSDTSLEAIIVTEDTLLNAQKINNIRKKKKIPLLEIIVVDFIKGTNHHIIRSEHIRSGTMNRKGVEYLTLFTSSAKIVLPQNMRSILRVPFGIIMKGDDSDRSKAALSALEYIKSYVPTGTIFVGDIVHQSLKDVGFTPDIAVIDFKTQRKNLEYIKSYETRFLNPAGEIRRKAVSELVKRINRISEGPRVNEILAIRGEEDLLALPAILLSPLGTLVLYGQFELGIIVVHATEEKKEEIYKILSQFEKSPNI